MHGKEKSDMTRYSIHVYDAHYRGLCLRRPWEPIVARARLTETTGHLWWKRRNVVEGYAIVQAVFEPCPFGGDDWYRPVKFFADKDEAMAFAGDLAVTVRRPA